jgi:hypothetical protein
MSAERKFFLNYFPNLYQHLKKEGKEKEARIMARDLLKRIFNGKLEKNINRFLELPAIGFIPADTEYFNLYYELLELYTSGFYYSTIVLAGVLNERICYDILAKQNIQVGKNMHLSPEQIGCLYEMNLAYLINLLHEWRLIKERTKKEMFEINTTRNRYVHPKEADKNLEKDALTMFKRITRVLKNEFEMEAIL